MKFKKRLLLGFISTIAVACTAIGFLTTSVCAPTNNLANGAIAKNESNVAYIYLEFTSDDPEVVFTGGTSTKIRNGKTFGTIAPPTVVKTGYEFQYWYYINPKTERQVELKSNSIIDDTIPMEDDKLLIYPLFEPTKAFHVTFESNGGILESGPSKSPFLAGQTFDSVQKPIVTPANEYLFFTGWYTTKDDSGERILDNFVLQNDISVYAHFSEKFFPDGGNPINRLLHNQDVSESLNITALSGDVQLTADLFGEDEQHNKIIAYYWNYDPQGHHDPEGLESGLLSVEARRVTIPEGNTICLVSGRSRQMSKYDLEYEGPYAFSYENFINKLSFSKGGEVALSGTTEGLLDWGNSDWHIDNLADETQLPSPQRGASCFESLFEDADGESTQDNQTKLSLSNDIAYQKIPFLPATTIPFAAYKNMFLFCDTIKSIPEYFLRGSLLYENCYENMFAQCYNLETIPATLFGTSPITFDKQFKEPVSYFSCMFCDCISLKYVPKFPQFSLFEFVPEQCCYKMFSGCTSLTSIHENLFSNRTAFSGGSLQQMFNGCSSLTQIPTLVGYDNEWSVVDIDRLAFAAIFSGCENVTYIDPNFFEWTYHSDSGGRIGDNAFFEAFAGLMNITIFSSEKEQPGTGYEVIINPNSDVWGNLDIAKDFGAAMFHGCVYEGDWPAGEWNVGYDQGAKYWIKIPQK